MELSIYLAQLLGVVYVVLGLAFLLRPAYYQKAYKAFIKDAGLLYFTGITVLVLGFVLVTAHNVWEYSWVVIITLFGWAALVKGVLLLLMPGELEKLATKMMKSKGLFMVAGVGSLILGGVLTYFGYFV